MGASVSLFREPDAGNLPVRFDEREQETGPSQTGLRRATRKPHPTATGRLQLLRLFSTLLANSLAIQLGGAGCCFLTPKFQDTDVYSLLGDASPLTSGVIPGYAKLVSLNGRIRLPQNRAARVIRKHPISQVTRLQGHVLFDRRSSYQVDQGRAASGVSRGGAARRPRRRLPRCHQARDADRRDPRRQAIRGCWWWWVPARFTTPRPHANMPAC